MKIYVQHLTIVSLGPSKQVLLLGLSLLKRNHQVSEAHCEMFSGLIFECPPILITSKSNVKCRY